jgi:N-glycosylase/DNA lyase
MKEKKLVKIGKWLNTLGYDLDLKDDFWMEDFIIDHKFRDLADLLDRYHAFKLNMRIVSRMFKEKLIERVHKLEKDHEKILKDHHNRYENHKLWRSKEDAIRKEIEGLKTALNYC